MSFPLCCCVPTLQRQDGMFFLLSIPGTELNPSCFFSFVHDGTSYTVAKKDTLFSCSMEHPGHQSLQLKKIRHAVPAVHVLRPHNSQKYEKRSAWTCWRSGVKFSHGTTTGRWRSYDRTNSLRTSTMQENQLLREKTTSSVFVSTCSNAVHAQFHWLPYTHAHATPG